ncbi:MAG: MarR family transcriptional regulator [Rhodospirillaceae bacterium]
MTDASTPHMRLAPLLVRAFRWFEAGIAADPETRHLPRLSGSQFMAMVLLDPDGTGISELARRIGVSRQAMHQMVGELESAALIETVPSPRDGRVKLVKLSLLGRTLEQKAGKALGQLENDLEGRIGADEMAALRRALTADWGPAAG